MTGLLALLDSNVVGPVNIGDPNEFTMLDFARLVIEITGSTSEIVHHPLPSDDPKVRRPDISLADRDTGLGAHHAARRRSAAHDRIVRRRRRDSCLTRRITARSRPGPNRYARRVPTYEFRCPLRRRRAAATDATTPSSAT